MKNSILCLLLLVVASVTQPAAAQLYDVRQSSINHEKRERSALKVQIDGTPEWTRDFWQSWLKDTYNIKVKGNGLLGVGKRDILVAKQVPASSVSGKLIDLYALVTAPSDTVTELAVFAAFDSDTYFDPEKTPSEYAALRNIVTNFASAARLKAYREQIAVAEKELRETEKEKERLEKERVSLSANTQSNLDKIEALKKQNAENKVKSSQDSVQLITNAQLLETRKAKLQRRRDRLSTLDKK
ncbi:hypothetical protein [Hymenobacter sediminicola]|uniref:DUF4468 domain-containing protein n=1 Tax=Hymenobacter sediminicola TaxID=2761579 RepID=A0A7G7W9C5_9BACT|nr:hypothetical protein [Hymenobacter sediminicola]QNH62968.1 hypothetical protein H4317_03915 [Hymenobacter sediminicola]